jgi:uncharacterized membrane protein
MIQYFKRIPVYIYLSIIILLAFILRAFRLNFRSLWMDELFSVSDTNPAYSLSKVWENHLFTTHPPFNYIIQWVWYKIFGYNDLQARIPPMLFGVLSVVAIYLLVTELIDKKTGLIASFLLAINIFHIEYSQEARSYSLLCLMSIVLFYFFIKSIKDNKIVWYLLLSGSGTLLIYTHYTGLFLLAAQVLITCFLFLNNDIDKSKLMKFGTSFLLIGILILPLAPSILWLQKSGVGVDSKPETNVMVNYFSYYFGSQYTLVSVFAIFLIAALVAFALERERKFDQSYRLAFIVTLCWILVGLLVPYYKSITALPTFHIRYTIGIFPAFIILIAIGITRIRNYTFLTFTIIFIAVLTFINIHAEKRYYSDQLWKANYRSAVKEIVATKKANYAIWDLGSDGFADPIEPWAFYFRQNGVEPRFIDLKADSSIFLNEKGVWLISVLFSRGIEEKMELMKRHGYKVNTEINQFHWCNAILMLKE